MESFGFDPSENMSETVSNQFKSHFPEFWEFLFIPGNSNNLIYGYESHVLLFSLLNRPAVPGKLSGVTQFPIFSV